MIQIEFGCFLQGFSSLLENEQSPLRVDRDLIEWNGKIFYADAGKAAELYNKIVNSSGYNVDHNVFDLAQVLIDLIVNLIADYG
jgi:hypothetical protein